MYIYDLVDALYLHFPKITEGRDHRITVNNLQEAGLLKKRPRGLTTRQFFYIAFGLLTHAYIDQDIDRSNMTEIAKATFMLEEDLNISPISINFKNDNGVFEDSRTITLSAATMATLQAIYLNEKDEAAVLMAE